MAITIDRRILEGACKEIIETILFCLPNAYKGTVYQIGRPPELTATRITSGVIDNGRRNISWGLPERSDYNPPGKPWLEYRDEPGRPLEAMAWCVERQKSWTAEDPKNDHRSVRLQVEGMWEDFHHMEPVVVRKRDLYLGHQPEIEYPRNIRNQMIWRDSDYVVVAVIKIHFRPYTIKVESPETAIIKRLSRALGTELLSYQLREESMTAMRQLAQDKLRACNILSDTLRNTITKSGLIFSLIKVELGFLRDQWERLLLEHSDRRGMKEEAVGFLTQALNDVGGTSDRLGRELREVLNRFLDLSLPPESGENWVRMQIEERWNALFRTREVGEKQKREILDGIEKLKRSLSLGRDPEILAGYDKMPDLLKKQWADLIYGNTERMDTLFLNRLIHILENPSLNLPFQEKARKTLVHLKTLAEIIGQLEHNTNEVLREVLNGGDNGVGFNYTSETMSQGSHHVL